MKIIEASVLAFNKNENEFKQQSILMWEKGVRNIHYDVMDNIFVPNTAYNGEYLDFLKKQGFIISVHLMVKDVKKYVEHFLKYDIDYLTFHCEPINHDEINELIKLIKSKNIKAGIAIKPNTNINDYLDVIKNIDIITVMGVEPGFGGQKYIESTTDKLKLIKETVNKNTIIQLDGGVNEHVMKLTKNYVNFFVSGSFLINYSKSLDNLKEIIK